MNEEKITSRLEKIQKEWSNDSKIDQTNLGHEATRTPILHSKYLTILSNTKLQIRKAEGDYIRVRKVKYRYFKGEMRKDELDKLGWSQYEGRVPLKTEMDEYLKSDDDLIALTDKTEYLETIQFALESIMKSLASRTFDIKNAIEWIKIQNGLN